MGSADHGAGPAATLDLLRVDERGSVVEEVMARVGLAVEIGLLGPGERLPSVEELGATFRVSPVTVRRALGHLAAKGVVVSRRGRNGGTFVADRIAKGALHELQAYRVAASELSGLIDHRLALECGVAYAAAARASTTDVARLRTLVDALDAAPDWVSFRTLDPQFHTTIAAVAAGSTMADAVAAAIARLGEYYVPYPIDYLRRSNEDHRRIVAAIAAGDGAAAAAAAGAHVDALRSTLFVGRRRAT